MDDALGKSKEVATILQEISTADGRQDSEVTPAPEKELHKASPQVITRIPIGASVRRELRSSAEGWSTLSKVLNKYDDERINDCKEDMDTLLVFAGLFSAVITAFNVESYKTLQEDSGDTSARILLQISQQLSSFSATGSTVNSTSPPAASTPFQPSTASIQINILWFASLICSLVTASLSILVKQWLREYMSHGSLSPRAYVRVRHFRYKGLLVFRVFEIASLLPMLLQISLLLFFIGLRIFLFELNPLLAWVASGLIFAWLAAFGLTTLMPAISPSCPYKTPLLRGPLQIVHASLHQLWLYALTIFRFGTTNANLRRKRTWAVTCGRVFESASILVMRLLHGLRGISSAIYKSITIHFIPHSLSLCYRFTKSHHVSIINDSTVRLDPTGDIYALAESDAVFLDDELLSTIERCLVDASLGNTLACARSIIQHRVIKPVNNLGGSAYKLWSAIGSRNIIGATPITTHHLHKMRVLVLGGIERTLDDLERREIQIFAELLQNVDQAISFVHDPTLVISPEGFREGKVLVRLLKFHQATAVRLLTQLCNIYQFSSTLPTVQLDSQTALDNLISSSDSLLDDYMGQENNETRWQRIQCIQPSKLLRFVLGFIFGTSPSLLRTNRDRIQKTLHSFIEPLQTEAENFEKKIQSQPETTYLDESVRSEPILRELEYWDDLHVDIDVSKLIAVLQDIDSKRTQWPFVRTVEIVW
ncbi:hypothetical protein C8Q75DRAFT_731327 [Abortiporus biennis]|nr:hypothetical protein C8Q75DRAFT_731327 [Abortiporus biennis]